MDLLTPYKSVIYVNSADRTSGVSANFTIDLTKQLNLPNNYDQIVLINASIPKSYYSINSANRTFILIEGASNTTITLTIGNYDAQSLATAITTALNAATTIAATYTTTLSISLGKYVFTTSSATATSFNFTGKPLAYTLGFLESAYSFTTQSLTAPNIINLQYTSTINIFCDLVAGKGKQLALITPNQSNFGLIVYQETCPAYASQSLSPSIGTSANFYLQDEYGSQIDFNGIDCSFTCVMYKADDYHRRQITDKRLQMLESDLQGNANF